MTSRLPAMLYAVFLTTAASLSPALAASSDESAAEAVAQEAGPTPAAGTEVSKQQQVIALRQQRDETQLAGRQAKLEQAKLAQELEQMQARIAELEAQLGLQEQPEQPESQRR